jgi:hypothetical protein
LHDDAPFDDDFSPPRLDGFATNGFNTSRVTETVLNTAVQRLFDDATRRKELKERIQLLSAKMELEELRQQPEINRKTQQIIDKKQEGHVPIHERYEKILSDQQVKNTIKKAQIDQETLRKNPDEYQPTFKPKINSTGKQRDVNEFLQHQEKWQLEKQLKM